MRGTLFLLLGLAACGKPEVDRPDGGILPDAAAVDPPPTPVLDPYTPRVPYTVATLKGHAGGSAHRVFVEGAGNTVASSLLPSGDFCVDVPMRDPGSYTFRIFAQASDGQLSAESAMAGVEFDPAAPSVPGAQTCSGADPAGCAADVEECGNDRDDDCDSLIDDNDPDCSACPQDVLEPNDDVGAPRIPPGRYEGLEACDGDDDYYGVYARRGQTIEVRVFFDVSLGNLDLELLGPDHESVVASGETSGDDEVLVYEVADEGDHQVHVFGTSGEGNGYTLDLAVTGSE